MDEPLNNYQDLLGRVKKALPFIQGIDNQHIVISYKDLSLQTFINIDRNDSKLTCLRSFQERFALRSFLPTRLSREKRPALKEFVHNIEGGVGIFGFADLANF